MKIRNIFMYGMAFFCLFLISNQAIGQDIVKDVEITSEKATVEMAIETPTSYFIEIGGPDNYYHTQRVNFTNEINLSNLNEQGEKFKDGQYSLQVTPVFELTPEQRADLLEMRNANDQAGIAAYREVHNLPAEVEKFGMSFRILNGEFVVSSQQEGELNLPTMSSQWEMDHPSLYASVSLKGLDYPDHATDNTAMAGVAQVFTTDVIVVGSICVGLDCATSESFGFDTQRLKENNLRIHFNDTSNSASFPSNDWRITINDTTNGGFNYFAIEDASAGRIPFRVKAGAPIHSLVVDADGDIGMGTLDPVVEAHVVDGDTPTLRLEQNGSSGFQSQTWDLAGNETNFFVRDATNGSKLPFRILSGALDKSIVVNADGGLQFARYGDGNETGTATQLLGVDMNGNLIEEPLSSGGFSGSGTANFLPRFTAGTTFGDSNLEQVDFSGASIIKMSNSGTVNSFGTVPASLSYYFAQNAQANTGDLIETSTNLIGSSVLKMNANEGFRFYTSNGIQPAGTNLNVSSFLRMTIQQDGDVGIGTGNPSYKLEVCGDIGTTAMSVTTGISCSSDARFKKNVSPLQRSLEKVLNLQGVNYDWRIDEFPNKHFNEGQQIGFIAQEIEEVLPLVVQTGKDGYKSVDYSRLTPVLVEAIKEQQAIIGAQQAEINALQSQVASLEELKAQVAALTQMVMKQNESAKANAQVGDE